MDGGWTDWHVVSGCSVTCGSGLQKRTRTCTNPPPAFGGKSCSGNDTDHIPCMPKHCSVDGEWSNWKSWSTCSNTCGEGYMMRVRSCNNPSPAYGGKECPDTSYTLQSCNLRHCSGKIKTFGFFYISRREYIIMQATYTQKIKFQRRVKRDGGVITIRGCLI